MGKDRKAPAKRKGDKDSDAKKHSKTRRGPNAIKKDLNNKQIKQTIKDKDKDLMEKLNIDVGEMLREELNKLNIKATRIETAKKEQKEEKLRAFLASYGRDHDQKLVAEVERAMQEPEKLSRGQRKRLKQKEKVARRKVLAQKGVGDAARKHVQVNLKHFKFNKPAEEAKNPSAIEKGIEGKKSEPEKDEKMEEAAPAAPGVHKRAIAKQQQPRRKRKSKLAKASEREYTTR